MTPEAAVHRLFDIIATRTEFTEDAVYAAMVKAGVPGPPPAASFPRSRAVGCFSTGWASRFSPDYTCFNGGVGDRVGPAGRPTVLCPQPPRWVGIWVRLVTSYWP